MANSPKTAIRPKGSPFVKIESLSDIKNGFTLGVTISLSGIFLKPMIIAKGKTTRSLNKYDIKNKFIGMYNKSGWADENCILKILEEIIKKTKNENSLLLLDQYTSHMTPKVKKYAENNKIKLLYVPKGLTYKYQPLDVGVFGILKKKASKYYTEYVTEKDNSKYTHTQCTKDLIKIMKEIDKKTITKSFKCLLLNKSVKNIL